MEKKLVLPCMTPAQASKDVLDKKKALEDARAKLTVTLASGLPSEEDEELVEDLVEEERKAAHYANFVSKFFEADKAAAEIGLDDIVDVINRLRGVVQLPVEDGLGAVSDGPDNTDTVYTRFFDAPEIQFRAAALLEGLVTALANGRLVPAPGREVEEAGDNDNAE